MGQPNGDSMGQPNGDSMGQPNGDSMGQPNGDSMGQPTGSVKCFWVSQPSGPLVTDRSGNLLVVESSDVYLKTIDLYLTTNVSEKGTNALLESDISDDVTVICF
jgi:hypothetical protein